jgi:phage host-nuclease inhibitor protein Gam
MEIKDVPATEPCGADLERRERALEEWTKTDRVSWPAKSIELKLAVETIIERLRTKKMQTCIRTVEDVDKEALAAYEDEVLADVPAATQNRSISFITTLKKKR